MTRSHRRGAEVDRTILEATILQLADEGVSGCSIEAVARRAGVNKTTVYRRWSNPEELLAAALGSHAEREVPIAATGDLRADLLTLVTDISSALSSPLGQALMAASHDLDPTSQIRRDYWSRRFAAASRILESAAVSLEPEARHEWLEALVAPIHFRLQQSGSVVDRPYLERLVDRHLVTLDP